MYRRKVCFYILGISFWVLACDQKTANPKIGKSYSKKPNEKVVINDIDISKFDSVMYYADVSWISYKGINELKPEELSYPFTVFCYTNDQIEMRIYFSKDKVMKRYIKKYEGLEYVQIKSYSSELRDTVYGVTLFINDSTSVTFGGNKLLMRGDGEVYFKHFSINILNANTGLLNRKWYSYGYSGKSYSLGQVLEWMKKKNLINDFDSQTEEVLELRDGNIYRIYSFVNYKHLDEKYSNHDKVLQNKDIVGHSFFYFFNEKGFSDMSV